MFAKLLPPPEAMNPMRAAPTAPGSSVSILAVMALVSLGGLATCHSPLPVWPDPPLEWNIVPLEGCPHEPGNSRPGQPLAPGPHTTAGHSLPGAWAEFHGGRAPACQLALPPDPSHVLFVPRQEMPGVLATAARICSAALNIEAQDRPLAVPVSGALTSLLGRGRAPRSV